MERLSTSAAPHPGLGAAVLVITAGCRQAESSHAVFARFATLKTAAGRVVAERSRRGTEMSPSVF